MEKRGWIGPPAHRRKKRPVAAAATRQRNDVSALYRPSVRTSAPSPSSSLSSTSASTPQARAAAAGNVGNVEAWQTFVRWLAAARAGRESRVCLLIGPSGIGKTTGVARCVGGCAPLVEIVGGDVASSDELTFDLTQASTRAGLEGMQPVVLLDDIDSIVRHALAAVMRFATTPRRPSDGALVYTCCGALPYELAGLRQACCVIHMNRLSVDEIAAIVSRRFPELAPRVIRCIASGANGDARQALMHASLRDPTSRNDTSATASGADVPLPATPFQAARSLLYERTTADQVLSIYHAHDGQLLPKLIWDNFLHAMSSGVRVEFDDVAARANLLSEADVMRVHCTRTMLNEAKLLWGRASAGKSAKVRYLTSDVELLYKPAARTRRPRGEEATAAAQRALNETWS